MEKDTECHGPKLSTVNAPLDHSDTSLEPDAQDTATQAKQTQCDSEIDHRQGDHLSLRSPSVPGTVPEQQNWSLIFGC